MNEHHGGVGAGISCAAARRAVRSGCQGIGALLDGCTSRVSPMRSIARVTLNRGRPHARPSTARLTTAPQCLRSDRGHPIIRRSDRLAPPATKPKRQPRQDHFLAVLGHDLRTHCPILTAADSSAKDRRNKFQSSGRPHPRTAAIDPGETCSTGPHHDGQLRWRSGSWTRRAHARRSRGVTSHQLRRLRSTPPCQRARSMSRRTARG